MLKKSIKLTTILMITLFVWFAVSSFAFAQTGCMDKNGNEISCAQARCLVNGREVPCAELGNQIKGFLGWGIGFFLAFIAFGIFVTAFWVMMIVHVATHDVTNKPMWIVILVFTGIVGAIIYYFVVKKKFNQQKSVPPVVTTSS